MTSTISRFAVAALLSGLLAAASEAQDRVSFITADGGFVVADMYGEGAHAVVLAHGGRFDRASWSEQARVLAGAGFRALAIDFRGRGDSRPGPGAEEDYFEDVLAAVRHLRALGAQRVSVIGASFGGGAAARAAVRADPGEIERLVLLAHSPIDEPDRIQGRKLFITTRGDYSGDRVPRLPDIRDQYERAPGPKELIVLDGEAHAQHVFATGQGDRLMREILRFLSDP